MNLTLDLGLLTAARAALRFRTQAFIDGKYAPSAGGKYTQWVKAACGLMGRPVGAPRAPLRAATAAELKELKAALAQTPEAQRLRKR